MVLINLQVLRCLSELISPAAAGDAMCRINSYGMDDKDPVLNLTVKCSASSILVTYRWTYGGGRARKPRPTTC